ncbi:hypothetical protein LCGC14_3012770 [marine sediment metagenome]|uniref:Uncharacterized protein n=1 Tax=marine sediment metagenome TaxID=412755 RepID=A0A0F8Z5C2_9ZZZZ
MTTTVNKSTTKPVTSGQPVEKGLEAKAIVAGEKPGKTSPPPPPTSDTIRSSGDPGVVWLRSTVREEQAGSCESNTET